MISSCSLCSYWVRSDSAKDLNMLMDIHMDSQHTMDPRSEDRLSNALQRPLLYVAGPMMSHGNPLLNVRNGCFAASEAYKAGWTPIVPHIDVLYQLITGEDNVEDYLTRDYAYIKACRAVWFLDGWEHSHGAKEEMKLVKAHCIPHFFGKVKRPTEAL